MRAWDLRKQKTISILNNQESKDPLKSVSCLAYDESGKYLAFGGEGGVHVTTVKEWGTTASIPLDHPVSGVVMGQDKLIATCSSKERAVRFHGIGTSD